jgi:hypothetical protein
MNDRLAQLLLALGLRGWHARIAGLGSVGLCLTLWVRAKTVDQQERGNAERRAIFVGLWPPTLYLIGETLDHQAARPAGLGARRFPRVWRRGPFG